MLISLLFCDASVYTTLVPFVIMDRREVVFTSSRSQCVGTTSKFRRSKTDRLVDELLEPKFQAFFHIPNSLPIQLTNGEALSTDELPHNMIYFTKK